MSEPPSDNPKRPLVSVIMPAYNCGPWIAEAIETYLAQDYSPMELVICDDGSTDNTKEVVKPYLDRVTFLQNNHLGPADARNACLRKIRGPLVAELDADDVWLPGKMSMQVQVMIDNPDAVICHTATELFGADSGDGPIVEEVRQRCQGMCFDAMFYRIGVMPTAMIWRRDAQPPHLLHSELRNGEDYAFFLEMMLDRPVVYIPKVTARIRRRPNQLTADKGRRFQLRNGEARLLALDYLAPRMKPDHVHRLREWALDELNICAYSRYWLRDFVIAREGFGWLRRYGRKVKWKHRARAWVGSVLKK